MVLTKRQVRFQPFSEEGPTTYYKGHHLPHLRQTGCTYFVTFRLADSVPNDVLKEWKCLRSKWLSARGIDSTTPNWRTEFGKLSAREKKSYERHYASALFETLDEGFGESYFLMSDLRHELKQGLKHFDGVRFMLGDFVIMPNHVHALMTPLAGFELEQILHSIKSYTSSTLNKTIGRRGQLWMKESYDRLTRDGEELLRTQQYIRDNPTKANLKPGQFLIEMATYCLED